MRRSGRCSWQFLSAAAIDIKVSVGGSLQERTAYTEVLGITERAHDLKWSHISLRSSQLVDHQT
jgi:hypothetical protein